MDMAEKPPIADKHIVEALNTAKISFQHYTHPDFSTCEKSAKWHQANQQLGRRVKNLFLRNKNGKQHFLLILPHEIEFDKAIFKQHSTQKCGLASDERLWGHLHVKPGAVSPLNLIYDENQSVKVFIEATLLQAECLHFHVGSPESSVTLKPEALIVFLASLGYEVQPLDWFSTSHD